MLVGYGFLRPSGAVCLCASTTGCAMPMARFTRGHSPAPLRGGELFGWVAAYSFVWFVKWSWLGMEISGCGSVGVVSFALGLRGTAGFFVRCSKMAVLCGWCACVNGLAGPIFVIRSHADFAVFGLSSQPM